MENASISPSLRTSFIRSQLSSVIATIVDFACLIGLVEIFGMSYVLATALGAFVGAVTNFTLGRHWSFVATHSHFMFQGMRYAVVSGGSLALNTLGVYAFTDGFGLHYPVSKVIVALIIGIFYNFPLHRTFVFRKPSC